MWNHNASLDPGAASFVEGIWAVNDKYDGCVVARCAVSVGAVLCRAALCYVVPCRAVAVAVM